MTTSVGDVTAADRGTRRENCGAGDDARHVGAERRGHCRVFDEGERGRDESERKRGDWGQEPDRAEHEREQNKRAEDARHQPRLSDGAPARHAHRPATAGCLMPP